MSTAFGLSVLGLGGCAKPTEKTSENPDSTVDVSPTRFEVTNPEMYQKLSPGMTGVFQIRIDDIDGVDMEADYHLESDPELLKVNAGNTWKAIQPGTGSLAISFEYTKDSLERLEKANPGKNLEAIAIAPVLNVIVGEPVYRFENPQSGQYIFTCSARAPQESDYPGWTLAEAVCLNAPSQNIRDDESSYSDIYTARNPETGDIFYSVNAAEIEQLVNEGWTEEESFGKSYAQGEPVYRLYNAASGFHTYSPENDELNRLEENGWTREGVAWYCLAPSVSE